MTAEPWQCLPVVRQQQMSPLTSGSALIADSGATVEGTNASGKFSIDGTSGQASGLLLENGGSFTVNAGGLASNTTVGHRGTLTLAAGEV